MTYERLTIEAFGAHLFDSLDLDPVYVLLAAQELPRPALARWLLAYWCYYDVGFASWAAESMRTYWGRMKTAALNIEPCVAGGRWPRGRERRHFRGKAAVTAVDILQLRYEEPERLLDYLAAHGQSYRSVALRVKALPMFGPWIAFKVADMLERVAGVPVSFDEAAVFLFDSPREAAVEWYAEQTGGVPAPEQEAIDRAVAHLLCVFGNREAPPRPGRKVNLQEIETVLCKWKSHRHGHYPLGNDLTELGEHLPAWAPHSDVAAAMLARLAALQLVEQERRGWVLT